MGCYLEEGMSQQLYLFTVELNLNLTVGTVTCSSVTVSWTTVDNRAANITILYNSTVHSGDVGYMRDASPPHTRNLTNLVADTEYTITVTAKYSDNTTTSGTVIASTKSGTPSDRAILTTFNGSTSLSFKVRDPGYNAIYDCWVNSTDHRLHRWTKGTITTVSGLDPGTYYNIACQKRPKRAETCPIAHAVVATKPNPPANVTITQTTCNSVTVNWTFPTDNGNAEITQYRVHVYKDSDHPTGLINDTTQAFFHRVTSLEPDTDYTVEVRAGNVGGFGNGTSTNFTTEQTGRMPIRVLAQSTSVNITISGSGEVYSCTLNDQTVNITSGQAVQLTGLTANTKYTVNCYSVKGSCSEARATFITAQRPGVVSDLMSGPVSVSENDSKVQLQQSISWQPPALGDVSMYLVRYGMGVSIVQEASFNATTTNTSIVLTLSVPDRPFNMVVYNIWVAVVIKSKEQGSFTLLSIQYTTPKVPRELEVHAMSCNSIRVSWLPPSSSRSGGLPLISYRVRYNGTELYISRIKDEKVETNITGLQPSTLYAITVSSNNTLGWGAEKKRTTTTMPRLTWLFDVSNVTSTNITITSTVVGRSKHLQCNMSNYKEGRNSFTFTQESLVLTGLTPNTQYTIHCVGDDREGSDGCVKQTMNVTTRKNPPGQVTNVRRDGYSWVAGGRIYQPIVWDEPRATGDNEVPETYVVKYKATAPGTDKMTTNTTETSLVLSFPLPQQAVTYIVSVSGKAGTERGSFSNELTLNYSRPGTPTGVTVKSQSCHTLKVTWSSPDHTGGLPITGYNISYTDTRNNKMFYKYSNTTVISLQQLKPGTKYIVRVRAMNAIREGDLTQRSGRTSQRREGYVNVTANSAHSILLSHNLTESGVGYVCNVTDVERGEKRKVSKIVLSRFPRVNRLLPDTTYKVDCVAYHSDGVEACLEVNTTVTTWPDRVHNVTIGGSRVQAVHSNDSIGIIQNITWDAPPNHHNIQHYLIKYQMQGQPTSSETRTSSNATQATLVLLVPQGQTSSYSVWVAAVLEAGQGEVSERVDFNYSIPNPATQLKAVNSTWNSITLTWSPPHYTGGVPLEGYAVRWRVRGSPLVTDGPDVTAVTITHLSPNTSYSVSVTAVNAIGNGAWSDTVLVTTTPQAPAVPVTDITVTRVNGTVVRVTWMALTLNDARGFPSYVVSVRRRCEQIPSQTTNSTSVVVRGLMPHTEYNITVQALTAGGTKEGPISEPVTLQKKPLVQPEPPPEQSATAATIGGFVGGTVFGVLATLLVGGIVMGAVRMARKEAHRRKHSAAVDASTCLAPDAIPMDTNPSYEEVHVYEHIDKKDSKQ